VITGRLARLARRLGLDRNPLRRRTDRIETWIMVGLLVLFLIGVPLSWLGIGRWVQQGGLREQRAQQSWRTVPAVVVKGHQEPPQVLFRLPMNSTVPVLARWRAPGGPEQAKQVAVPAVDARTGSRVQVWVDSSGRVTGPPLASSQLTKRVIGAQVLAQVTLVALLLGLAGLVRWQLNRRRLASWESEWATTGPGWTRHR
jgi:hypothetical protein